MSRRPGPPSVRPGAPPAIREIVRIGDAAPRRLLGLGQLEGDAVALAIGDRRLLGVEAQAQLLAHVARAGPTHQRLDLARLRPLVVKRPPLCLWGARMPGGPGPAV